MHIAIEGCCHGSLDKIYETLQYIEAKENIEIDLLICCGDFEAIRNEVDLQCMAVPDKYKTMNDFWKYYAGTKTAPYLTIFIGGNHEASNHLQELPYGGWVAPKIYYLGYAGVVNYKGLRIGGLSGIFKQHDYSKGHCEMPPYTQQTMRSVYHIRHMEVFRLKQLKQPIDIMLSHDWPNGIVHHGDKDNLLRKKKHFTDDIRNHQLGSLPAWDLLNTLRPSYWFSGHLHVKFAAKVEHQIHEIDLASMTNKNIVTRFLALDKCLPRRDFLQVLDIDCDENNSAELSYDAEWLAVLKSTNELMSTSPRPFNLLMGKSSEDSSYTLDVDKIKEIMEIMDHDLKIPLNFRKIDSCVHDPEKPMRHVSVQCQVNQQTTELCGRLEINDPVMMLIQADGGETSFNASSRFSEDGEEMPSTIISNASINPDEIDLDDEDDDEIYQPQGGDGARQEMECEAVELDDSISTSVQQERQSIPKLNGKTPKSEPLDPDLHSFKTPIRIAANFMNLPKPMSSTPKMSPLVPDEDAKAPLETSSSMNTEGSGSSPSDLSKKRKSNSSPIAEIPVGDISTSTPRVRKFKRINV